MFGKDESSEGEYHTAASQYTSLSGRFQLCLVPQHQDRLKMLQIGASQDGCAGISNS